MLPSVLVVDDEKSIVQSLSGLLTDEGFFENTVSREGVNVMFLTADCPW